MAARRVADATRFQQNVRSPSGETPQQRVARLREAARRAKKNQITTFDKVVHHGRIWADRLHRGFIFGIIGFSGVTAMFLGYSVYGIMNKAKENKQEYAEYVAEEKRKFQEKWRTTQIGHLIRSGLDEATATEAFEAIEAARAARNTTWGKFKTWAKGGMTPAEEEYSSDYDLYEDKMRTTVLAAVRKDRAEKMAQEAAALGQSAQVGPAAVAAQAQGTAFAKDGAGSHIKETSPFLSDGNAAAHGNTGSEDSTIISEAKKSKSGFTSWFTR